jgi:hypothetical protein
MAVSLFSLKTGDLCYGKTLEKDIISLSIVSNHENDLYSQELVSGNNRLKYRNSTEN